MRVLRTIVPVLLALVLLATMTPSISAQDDSSEAGLLAGLDGLEKMYGRAFTVDFMALAESGSPDSGSTGWFALYAAVFAFDSDASAAASVDHIASAGLVPQQAAMQDEADVETVTLNIDMPHAAAVLKTEEDGVTEWMTQVVVQDGAFVYAVYGITSGIDPAPVLETVITGMSAAEVGDEPEAFSEDGTSTGGLWAKLPAPEDVASEVETLTKVEDEITFPVAGATPAA